MTRLLVEPDVLDAFPDLMTAVVVARGVRNDTGSADVDRAVSEALAAVIADPNRAEHPHVVAWRATHAAFGSNPRRFRSSVDALVRRVLSKGDLPRINPVVDAYNAVSLRHVLPAGAYDLSAVRGDVRLRRSAGEEPFQPLGSPGPGERTFAGEVVYADNGGVLTRRWNHRDGERTKVTAESTDVVLLVERADAAIAAEAVGAAAAELTALITSLGADVRHGFVHANSPTYELAG